MTIGQRLQAARKERGINQETLAKALGVQRAAISKYENDTVPLKFESALKIAELLNIDPYYLIDDENKINVGTFPFHGKSELRKEIPGAMPIGNLVALKLIASVRAGYGGTAVADWDGEYENIPEFMLKGYPQDECVLFKVKGDSMYPRLLDGDLIVVHVQSSVDSGDTAIIVYNGDEGTVKKVNYVYGEDWLELIPTNPEYPKKRIEGADLEQCHVYGKVLGLFGNI